MAIKVINGYVELIHSFRVLFNNGKTAETVEYECITQITELENLIKNKKDLITAQQTLGISHLHPDIIRALAEKADMIRQSAERQLQKLDKAGKIITAFIEQINSFPVIYDATSSHLIDEQRRTFIVQSALLEQRIRDSEELAQAQRVMGIVGLHPSLEHAFANKIRMIRQASEEQNYRHNIVPLMQQINSFPVIYNPRSTYPIEEQRRTLIVQFADLEKRIRRIQQSMGIVDLHPSLEHAFADKIKIIREQADNIIKNKAIYHTLSLSHAPDVPIANNTTPTISRLRLFSATADSLAEPAKGLVFS